MRTMGTERLILQPRIETNFSGKADLERGIGSGFNDVQLGLRLRRRPGGRRSRLAALNSKSAAASAMP